MQLQDLSYKVKTDYINLGDYKVHLELFSLENIYYPKEKSLIKHGNLYESNQIVFGETENVEGNISLEVHDIQNGYSIKAKASLDKDIRCLKIAFNNLPLGDLITLSSEDKKITEFGELYRYPEGWRSLSQPLLIFKLENSKYLVIKDDDYLVREKRYYLRNEGGLLRLDYVFESRGVDLSKEIETAHLEVTIENNLEDVYKKYSDFLKKKFSLEDFSERKDVPNWFKDISLVVTMHMEHFTGKIFHTYKSALEDVKKLCEYIDGKHILIYLAGWEGRYYYKYGDYSADSRLGGEEELIKLVNGIHNLGCHCIAMYGINIANIDQPEISALYSKSECQSISGAKFHNGSVDWEGAHHYDFAKLGNLNIGSKLWQDYLFNQIKHNTLKYDFDGCFLDIAAYWVNDLNHDIYEGVCEFANRLHTIKDDFLISGEGFYDGLAKCMPLFQSGHTDGKLHYHDRVSPLLFTRYVREFAHLCIGDPSYGSSGVHELGINSDRMTPLREGIIPTLSLVDGSIDNALDKVLEIVEQAKEYYRRYLR